MSTPCYYCELDPGSCELCIHEVNIEDLLQQARREGWEQGKKEATKVCTDKIASIDISSEYDAGKCNVLSWAEDAISAMEYGGEK